MSRVTLRQTGRAILVFHHRSERENSSVWNCVRSVPGRDMFFDQKCPNSAGPGNKPRQQHEDRAGSNAIGGNSSSTQRWNDVPRGTMDEVSSHVRLDLPFV